MESCCGKYSTGTISLLSPIYVDQLLFSFHLLYIYPSPFSRETPDETEINSLPPSVHPVLRQLISACLRASPNDRPSFKVISAFMDILFLQIHLINQDYLEMAMKKDKDQTTKEGIQRELAKKYQLNEGIMEEILLFLSSQQHQGNKKPLFLLNLPTDLGVQKRYIYIYNPNFPFI